MISLPVVSAIGLLIMYGIISTAVGGIKRELKRQTHIMGLMAQKSGITAEKLNSVLKKH